MISWVNLFKFETRSFETDSCSKNNPGIADKNGIGFLSWENPV